VEKSVIEVLTATKLALYLDEFLHSASIPDHANAWNGLQVDREGPIERVALAVDAAQATIEMAAEAHADLLIVHHGLFWDGRPALTERRYRRVKALVDANIGVYASHLPLDVHGEVGNNVVLARRLGIAIDGTFGDYRGTPLGVHGRLDVRREALAARLDEVLGCRVRMIAGGPERLMRVGVITGGAGDYLEAARQIGLDGFITGEGAHHNYHDAIEGGVNLYFGGHYATEVWGIRALGNHLHERFSVNCVILDRPTGL